MNIFNNKCFLDYNVTSYGGTKSIYISTTSNLGRASLLGWVLIAGASANVFTILVVLMCLGGRGHKLEDFDDLRWK